MVFAPALAKSSYESLGESLWPPLGILYLASYLRHKIGDVELRIVDGCQKSYDETLKQVIEFKPDILGISFYTTLAEGAAQLSKDIRATLPHCWVVLGGPHATALPMETLHDSQAHIVVVGEGEEVFYQIVKTFRETLDLEACYALPGVYCFDSKQKLQSNAPCPFIKSLDDIPFPAFDLIDLSKYRGWYLTKQKPELIILSARGCPFNCIYCSNAVWKSSSPALRIRSPKNVVDELEQLHHKFGIREVFDNADEFNNNIKNAVAICEEIKQRDLKITWKAQLRAKPVTDELAAAMASAGCWYVHLGIESGNQETLDGIGKHITLEDVEQACRTLKRHGIKILGLFMLYNVWEKDGELKFEDHKASLRTLNFAHSLVRRGLLDYISWSVTTPYPGSHLYSIALKHNLIRPQLQKSWELWQKESLFILDLPGISRWHKSVVKIKGEWIRFLCIVRNWDFGIQDFPFLLKRALHIVVKTLFAR